MAEIWSLLRLVLLASSLAIWFWLYPLLAIFRALYMPCSQAVPFALPGLPVPVSRWMRPASASVSS